MKWEAPFGGSTDVEGVVPGPVREGPVSAPACSAGDRGVRSPGSKPKRPPFHPVVAGQEKTGKWFSLSGSGAAASHLGVMGERE